MNPISIFVEDLRLVKKILVFTLIALLSVFFIDHSYSKHNQAVSQKALIEEIKRQNQAVSTIDLRQLFDFKWDEVYVFSPGTELKVMEETLGFTWFDAKSTKIDQRDDANLIVFVENHQVAQYVMLPTKYGILKPTAQKGTFTVEAF
ncbi:hypothetical protein J2S09_000649 [Bacillus fengqiuensis]|nr:hypothetical protein [Bacillus fengqiuensis]